MIILRDIIQGSPEWHNEKLGKVSASNINKIITATGGKSIQRDGYMNRLAAEIITGRKAKSFKSDAMNVGNERENESRSNFEFHTDLEVEQVGIIYKNDKKLFLCSPDGIIKGKKQGTEFKNPEDHTQIKRLRKNKLPTEYFVQVQSSLYITGFECWHFFSYVPDMKPLHIIVEPNKIFHNKLKIALNIFCKELAEITERLK